MGLKKTEYHKFRMREPRIIRKGITISLKKSIQSREIERYMQEKLEERREK